MKLTEHRSDILDAKVRELGFIVGKEDEYAAIPLTGSETKLVIIHWSLEYNHFNLTTKTP